MIIISNDDRYEFGSLEVTRREGEEWGWDAQLEVAERTFLLKDNFFARQFFCNNSTIHIRIETLMIITMTTATMLVDKHHLHRLTASTQVVSLKQATTIMLLAENKVGAKVNPAELGTL